jgi:hypothetical protein
MLMRDSVQKYNPNLIPTGAANCSLVVQSKFKQIIFNPILIPTGGDALSDIHGTGKGRARDETRDWD